jgi:quinohemoprotein ethanol dehydrogenase
VVIHAPKSGFFYMLDRVTGEFISGDPITKVSWTSGLDPKTGKPNVNAGARYRADAVTVKPGPSGGHVWQPWTYSPITGLVYFPGTAGGSSSYRADPNYVPQPTIIEPGGRGRTQMGTGGGGGGARGGNRGAAPANAGQTGALTPEAAAVAANNTPTAAPAVPAAPLPEIGPDGVSGNVLYAWDPMARKERWRAPGGSAGPFAGGSISTAGNLVFSSVNDTLIAYRADTGEKVAAINLGTTQMGPPISFAIDGKQYIAVTAAQGGGAAAGLVVVEAVEVVPEPVEQARLVEQVQLAVVPPPRRVPHTCWCWPSMGMRRYRAQRRHPIRPDARKARSMKL